MGNSNKKDTSCQCDHKHFDNSPKSQSHSDELVHKHDHSHCHDVSSIKGVNLILVILMNMIITIAEVIGGIYSGSLSLISDAVHNFSDGISIIISYLAIKISAKSNDAKRTFGYKRATILAAFINSSILIAISIFLFKEAYLRFVNPEEIKGNVVIWVALIGLIANIIGVILLHKGSNEDINLKSSYLHLLGDTLSSVIVIIGGVLILYFNIYWVDPLLTVLINLYILKESFEILKKAYNILMQGVPEKINIGLIASEIQNIKSVEKLHHVHVWSIDENNINFEAHVNIKDMLVSETKVIHHEIQSILMSYGINHTTIQFEYDCCSGVDVIE